MRTSVPLAVIRAKGMVGIAESNSYFSNLELNNNTNHISSNVPNVSPEELALLAKLEQANK